MTFLYKIYDNAMEHGFINFKDRVPEYISSNLKHHLRPYQQEAIGRYMYYKNDIKNRKQPEMLLYNMATGSGKTLLMAAMLLEKFTQGYRDFIFFVNNENILIKTRNNFLGQASSKYLFSNKIMIDNRLVKIREVTDFSDSNPDSINVIFTTIQKLHTDLNVPRENRLSYEQFRDKKIVLIADEAHHLNAGLNKDETADNNSWTATINNIQKNAKQSSLFEFTATIDLEDKNIINKYKDHLLYKYDLKEFRLDKYSKDVLFHSSNGDVDSRMLQAIIISQYRKKVALNHGINLKPLVLFKSRRIADNRNNLNIFLKMLFNLSASDIQKQKIDAGEGILKDAFRYFEKHNISIEILIAELQEDFRQQRLLLIDGKDKTEKNLVNLNNLEDLKNEVRAIFSVDMLNEGWDVLNLFDIVRLYNTRDGKNTKSGEYIPGATTNREKQLIGRGARYYPFVVNGDKSNKYKRKFDGNELNELRALEQLHYHSANNPRYIFELTTALRDSGIYPDQTTVKRTLKLKDSFMQTRTYKQGIVWMNKAIPYKDYIAATDNIALDESFIPEIFEVRLPNQNSHDISIFNDVAQNSQRFDRIEEKSFKLSDIIEPHVIRAAINRNKNYTFKNLKNAFIGLGSINDFIKMLSNVTLTITGNKSDISHLTQENKLYVIEKLINYMEKDIIEVDNKLYGSKKFEPYKIKDLFENEILRNFTIDKNSDAEFGLSQKTPSESNYYENIDCLDWYAYDDNFGTSEEKALVRVIKNLMSNLKKKWTDIFLLRNEKAVKLFSFDTGQGYEPDYLMFANDKVSGNISFQIFIEPKGSQFLDKDGKFANGKEGWKEQFLNEITQNDKAKTLIDNDQFKIVGLPFFNEKITKNTFIKELKNLH